MRFGRIQLRIHASLLRPLVLAGLIVLLLWPSIWNRGPFYYIDTRTYMRSEDAAINKFTHLRTAWTAADSDAPAAPGSSSSEAAERSLHNIGAAHTRSLEDIKKKGIMLGRSLYWGLLLYLGAVSGGFWLTILVQAAAVFLALYLSVRALEMPVWPALPWICAGLCVLSDVSFFASYLMPDIFAGLTVLACAILISAEHRLGRLENVLWYLLLAFALLAHDTCVLLAVMLIGIAVAANLLRRTFANRRGLCVILLAAVTAYGGQSLVTYGITRATGAAPLRFPLIAARLVDDGPGTNYLRATCPQSNFTLCAYRSEFPMSSYTFLFGTEPGKSVYEMATYDQRRALSAEQFRFFLAVLRYDPLGVARSGLRNAAAQFLNFSLADFQYNPGEKDNMDRTFPLEVLAQIRSTAAYQGTMPSVILKALPYFCVSISFLYLLLVWLAVLPGRTISPLLKRVFLWAFAGIVLNAAICGGISANEARYQARVVWLVPLLALLVEASAAVDRHRRRLAQRRKASGEESSAPATAISPS